MSRSRLLPFSALLAAAACGPAVPSSTTPQPKSASTSDAAPGAPSQARYFLTQSQGAVFDEANKGVAVPRAEPAIVAGRRVMLEGGAVTAAARTPDGLSGFRSLPARLGGGYLVWSESRTYHAKDFLGALTPIVDIGPTAGARPWFRSVLLRTDRGIFELDLKARSAKRWRVHPGVVDALSIDDKRGVTVDAAGRVRATTDGGATWTDVTAARGAVSNGVRLNKKGAIELLSMVGGVDFQLLPDGSGVEPVPPSPYRTPMPYSRRYYGYGYGYGYPYGPPPPPEFEGMSPVSQTLAPDTLVWAASAGVRLDGERAMVGRDGGIVVLSTRTGGEINNSNLLTVESKYAGCQPVRAGTTVLLSCAHAEGAEVLVLDGPLGAPKLEATFPDVGTFISDDRGHLAYRGRCGRTPPSADDFGARVTPRMPEEYDDQYGPYGPYGPYGGYDPEYMEPQEEPPAREKPPADDARVCVRLDGGDWIEHRITGDEARDLYRWVLGEDGSVTALLLKGANPDPDGEGSDADKEKNLEGDDDDAPLRRPGGKLDAKRSPLLAVPPPPPPPAPRPAGTARPAAKPATKPPAKPDAAPKTDPKKPADAKKDAADASHDGIRIIRLDPKDRGVKHGKWTRVAPAQTQAPWRSIDRNFWLESDGSIRGWVRLPEEGMSARELEAMEAAMEESGEKPSPITEDVAGRFAGVRVSPEGKATVFSLPAHTRSVMFGGRFGFAKATDDDGEWTRYYETTDGGATWTEVEGPPVGEVEEVYDDSRWPACSDVGCSLGSGLVRLGWGSPKPEAPKKDKESPSASSDAFAAPRLPRLECTFEGAQDVFPAPPPKPKADAPPPGKPPTPTKPSDNPLLNEDVLSQLPPDLQEMLRQNGGSLPPGLAGLLPPGLLPPGLIPTGAPAVPPPPAPTAAPSAKPAPAKPVKAAPAKPPPPPPAEVITLRSKPQVALGQLKDKSWVGDFVAPFDPAAAVKHVSTSANTLEKLTGSVLPLVGDRGVDLLVTWDKRRAVLGSASPALLPFDYAGRFTSAALASIAAPGASAPISVIVALDDDRRSVVLIQPDASRAVLRSAKIPDPTRGRFAIARRLDAPGAGLVWYSHLSGDVLVGAIDFARAEIGPMTELASIGTLSDGGIPACAAKPKAGPTYQFIAELSIGVSVAAHSGKSLFTEGAAAASVLVRATSEQLCIVGIEVRGGGRPIDLTASFSPKSAAVSRSRASAEDPTKLTQDKLSCVLTRSNESKPPSPPAGEATPPSSPTETP